MTKKYSTQVPDKYMDGWNNIYKKQAEGPLNELPPHYVHYALQELYFFTLDQDKNGKNALDLATGDGRYACFLAQLGYDVTATEILPSALDITRKRAEALGVFNKMNIILSDMETQELRPCSYDVVSAIQCLQYLYDKALPKFYELLEVVKPGGFLLYGGNVKPHFKTEPPVRFITMKELRYALKDWTIFSIAREERIIKPGDKRGYVWVVAQKPDRK